MTPSSLKDLWLVGMIRSTWVDFQNRFAGSVMDHWWSMNYTGVTIHRPWKPMETHGKLMVIPRVSGMNLSPSVLVSWSSWPVAPNCHRGSNCLRCSFAVRIRTTTAKWTSKSSACALTCWNRRSGKQSLVKEQFFLSAQKPTVLLNSDFNSGDSDSQLMSSDSCWWALSDGWLLMGFLVVIAVQRVIVVKDSVHDLYPVDKHGHLPKKYPKGNSSSNVGSRRVVFIFGSHLQWTANDSCSITYSLAVMNIQLIMPTSWFND